ncbi:MAG TPA: hypothetical protein VMD91_18040 [Candidatus Sulfotelmatobacter sp.]|nr:hypothetical protein [Candidatus Sulfotelmatobacter sp.]
MNRRLPLVALTGLLASATTLGLLQKPATADAATYFSLNVGTPGVGIHIDNYRYWHDPAYRAWWVARYPAPVYPYGYYAPAPVYYGHPYYHPYYHRYARGGWGYRR